jgi:mono/diheme cytochrome c family protein
MKTTLQKVKAVAAVFAASVVCLFMVQCAAPQKPAEKAAMTQDEMIARGKYLVTIGGCHDCHSPKMFGPMGPEPDSTKALSGHPAGSPGPAIDTNALHPGWGYIVGADLTSWLGPWGISYTMNLTPDSATGIGAWTEENFMNALRKGKHLGLDGGRPILPPMPWQMIRQMTDEDLKSVYAYLRTLPAISNQIPAPVAPPDVMAMAMKK